MVEEGARWVTYLLVLTREYVPARALRICLSLKGLSVEPEYGSAAARLAQSAMDIVGRCMLD